MLGATNINFYMSYGYGCVIDGARLASDLITANSRHRPRNMQTPSRKTRDGVH